MKDLDYYMSLRYKIQVEELTEDEGGGLFLSIPELGSAAVCTHGDTYDQARAHLEQVKRDFLEIWLEEGCDIPEPQPDVRIKYVGKALCELGLVGA